MDYKIQSKQTPDEISHPLQKKHAGGYKNNEMLVFVKLTDIHAK